MLLCGRRIHYRGWTILKKLVTYNITNTNVLVYLQNTKKTPSENAPLTAQRDESKDYSSLRPSVLFSKGKGSITYIQMIQCCPSTIYAMSDSIVNTHYMQVRTRLNQYKVYIKSKQPFVDGSRTLDLFGT